MVLVEASGRLVDRIGDEQAKSDGSDAHEIERQSQRFAKEVSPETLPLNATVDREAGQQDAGNRELREPL